MTVVPQAEYGPEGLLIDKVKEYSCISSLAFKDLPVIVDGVAFRLISKGDRISLCLEIKDNTTIQNLKDCWYIVRDFRDRLREIQGEDPYGDNSFYQELLMWKKDIGLSSEKIAEKINLRIRDLLHDALNNEVDSFEYKFALWEAEDLLGLSRPRMRKEERKDLLASALQDIKNGIEPFVKNDWRIRGSDIREIIRYREEKKGVGKTG